MRGTARTATRGRQPMRVAERTSRPRRKPDAPGTESRRRLRPPRASYGSGDAEVEMAAQSPHAMKVAALDNPRLSELFSIES